MPPDGELNLFRGKSFLFLGDSTMRQIVAEFMRTFDSKESFKSFEAMKKHSRTSCVHRTMPQAEVDFMNSRFWDVGGGKPGNASVSQGSGYKFGMNENTCYYRLKGNVSVIHEWKAFARDCQNEPIYTPDTTPLDAIVFNVGLHDCYYTPNFTDEHTHALEMLFKDMSAKFPGLLVFVDTQEVANHVYGHFGSYLSCVRIVNAKATELATKHGIVYVSRSRLTKATQMEVMDGGRVVKTHGDPLAGSLLQTDYSVHFGDQFIALLMVSIWEMLVKLLNETSSGRVIVPTEPARDETNESHVIFNRTAFEREVVLRETTEGYSLSIRQLNPDISPPPTMDSDTAARLQAEFGPDEYDIRLEGPTLLTPSVGYYSNAFRTVHFKVPKNGTYGLRVILLRDKWGAMNEQVKTHPPMNYRVLVRTTVELETSPQTHGNGYWEAVVPRESY